MAKRRQNTPAPRDIPPAPEPLQVVESEETSQLPTDVGGTTDVGRLRNRINLDEIREEAVQAKANVAQSIAELEAWRAEIDATIAYLRATRS